MSGSNLLTLFRHRPRERKFDIFGAVRARAREVLKIRPIFIVSVHYARSHACVRETRLKLHTESTFP